jgi:pimeloyl-ACP methyl ester carboxylesterase
MLHAAFATLALSLLALPGSPQGAPLATVELGGVYDGGGEPLLVVTPVNDTLIRYRDLDTGGIGILARAAADRFGTDSARIDFVRTREGRIARARWSLGAGAEGRGERRLLLRESFSWTSGGETLSGTLILPDSAGDAHCTVVVQPGASWTSRYSSNALETAYTFAAHGIAALAYDKRGWGESTGERLVGFDASAADLAAAVDALGLRFDVDPGRLGVWALSQGAWIAPLAGTLTDGIGFYVLVGAPGTTPARQEIQRAGALLAALGRPADHVEAIERFQEISFRYSVTGRGWSEYIEARQVGERQDWLRHVWSPAEPGPDNFLWGRLNGYLNPLPALLALDEPLLALWGEHDVNVLPAVHLPIFEVALAAAGNRSYTLEVVPDAEHVLQVARSRAPDDTESRIAPGVWRRMAEWVRERCGLE